MFRRNQTTSAPTTHEPQEPEAIAINLDELTALESALLEAARLGRTYGEFAYYGQGVPSVHDAIALLYQRLGAASAVQPDPQRARIPLFRHEIKWLANAIVNMDRYWASERHLFSARQLHNRFNALLGHARATTYMGGTPVIASDSPQPATVRGTVVQGGIPECWDSRSS